MARMNRPAPVEVEYKNMRFLITHNPTNATLSTFIEVSGPHAWPHGLPRTAPGSRTATLVYRVPGGTRETWSWG